MRLYGSHRASIELSDAYGVVTITRALFTPDVGYTCALPLLGLYND